MKNKVISTFEEAVADIPDGASIMVFHWGLGRSCPRNLIRALHRKGAKDLTVISHNFTFPRLGDHFFDFDECSTPLMFANQVKKVITSVAGELGELGRVSPVGKVSPLESRIESGEVEVEITSHGTLAERIRAGASGLGGFYSPVGVGTILEKGKEKGVIDGKEYLLEKPLRADFGLVRAYKADKMGNLVFRGSARGCNPLIAMASDVTIVEVDEIVEIGELDPEVIVTPGIFVNRIVKVPEGEWGSASYMQSLFSRTFQALQEKKRKE